jgi:hypothetical protein
MVVVYMLKCKTLIFANKIVLVALRSLALKRRYLYVTTYLKLFHILINTNIDIRTYYKPHKI